MIRVYVAIIRKLVNQDLTRILGNIFSQIESLTDGTVWTDIICAATRNFITSENPTYRYWAPVAAAMRGFEMVLFTASRGNTFVGGTSASSSTLLVAAWYCMRSTYSPSLKFTFVTDFDVWPCNRACSQHVVFCDHFHHVKTLFTFYIFNVFYLVRSLMKI